MMRRSLLLLIALLVTTAFADMKVKTRMSTAGRGFESTQYIKGARQRTEMELAPGMKNVNIFQCDQQRMIIVNERTNRCMVVDLNEGETTPSATESKSSTAPTRPTRAPRPTGGVITITTNSSDTGERKLMFGQQARHIKTSMSFETSGNACNDGSMAMDSDGWYIDFPTQNLACTQSPRAAMASRPQKQECRDQIQVKHTGNARLGFPVLVETHMNAQGNTITTKQEALELSNAKLDDALFDMPPGCTVVNDYMALMGMGSVGDMMRSATRDSDTTPEVSRAMDTTPEAGGSGGGRGRPRRSRRGDAIKVGLITFGNSANAAVQAEALRMKLDADIEQFEFEAVEVNVPNATRPEDAEKAAQALGCQYFVYTDVTGVKDPSAGKKVGGFLSKMTGVSSSASNAVYESTIQYKVYEVNEPEEPRLQPELVQSYTSQEGSSADNSVSRAMEHEAGDIVVTIRTDLEHKRRGVK
jgi:hypothetical protein